MTPTPDAVPPTSPDQPPTDQAPMPTPEMAAATGPIEGNAPATGDMPTVPSDEKKGGGVKGEMQRVADDYVIPISTPALDEWAKTGDVEQFKAYAVQVAAGMYPNFAPQITTGIPTRILLDPYVQVAMQVLGPVMKQPNWSDPKWSAALNGGIDPKTNRPIPMTLDEWRKHLMTHPGHNWEQSPQAQERASQFSKIINDGFGGGKL